MGTSVPRAIRHDRKEIKVVAAARTRGQKFDDLQTANEAACFRAGSRSIRLSGLRRAY
jgi:hypothetical protein